MEDRQGDATTEYVTNEIINRLEVKSALDIILPISDALVRLQLTFYEEDADKFALKDTTVQVVSACEEVVEAAKNAIVDVVDSFHHNDIIDASNRLVVAAAKISNICYENDNYNVNNNSIGDAANEIINAIGEVLVAWNKIEVDRIVNSCQWFVKNTINVSKITSHGTEAIILSFRDMVESFVVMKAMADKRAKDAIDDGHGERIMKQLDSITADIPVVNTMIKDELEGCQSTLFHKDKLNAILKDMARAANHIIQEFGEHGYQFDGIKSQVYGAFLWKAQELKSSFKANADISAEEQQLALLNDMCMFGNQLANKCPPYQKKLASCAQIILSKKESLYDNENITGERKLNLSTRQDILRCCDELRDLAMDACASLVVDTFVTVAEPINDIINYVHQVIENSAPSLVDIETAYRGFQVHRSQVCFTSNAVLDLSHSNANAVQVDECINRIDTIGDKLYEGVEDCCDSLEDTSLERLHNQHRQFTSDIKLLMDSLQRLVGAERLIATAELMIEENLEEIEKHLKEKKHLKVRDIGSQLVSRANRVVSIATSHVDESINAIYRNGVLSYLKQLSNAIDKVETTSTNIDVKSECVKFRNGCTDCVLFIAKTRQALTRHLQPWLLSDNRKNVRDRIAGCDSDAVESSHVSGRPNGLHKRYGSAPNFPTIYESQESLLQQQHQRGESFVLLHPTVSQHIPANTESLLALGGGRFRSVVNRIIQLMKLYAFWTEPSPAVEEVILQTAVLQDKANYINRELGKTSKDNYISGNLWDKANREQSEICNKTEECLSMMRSLCSPWSDVSQSWLVLLQTNPIAANDISLFIKGTRTRMCDLYIFTKSKQIHLCDMPEHLPTPDDVFRDIESISNELVDSEVISENDLPNLQQIYWCILIVVGIAIIDKNLQHFLPGLENVLEFGDEDETTESDEVLSWIQKSTALLSNFGICDGHLTIQVNDLLSKTTDVQHMRNLAAVKRQQSFAHSKALCGYHLLFREWVVALANVIEAIDILVTNGGEVPSKLLNLIGAESEFQLPHTKHRILIEYQTACQQEMAELLQQREKTLVTLTRLEEPNSQLLKCSLWCCDCLYQYLVQLQEAGQRYLKAKRLTDKRILQHTKRQWSVAKVVLDAMMGATVEIKDGESAVEMNPHSNVEVSSVRPDSLSPTPSILKEDAASDGTYITDVGVQTSDTLLRSLIAGKLKSKDRQMSRDKLLQRSHHVEAPDGVDILYNNCNDLVEEASVWDMDNIVIRICVGMASQGQDIVASCRNSPESPEQDSLTFTIDALTSNANVLVKMLKGFAGMCVDPDLSKTLELQSEDIRSITTQLTLAIRLGQSVIDPGIMANLATLTNGARHALALCEESSQPGKLHPPLTEEEMLLVANTKVWRRTHPPSSDSF